MSKCPKCDTPLGHLVIQDIEMNVPGGRSWRGNAYTCPRCCVIISVAIDHVALKAELVADIIKGLGRRERG